MYSFPLRQRYPEPPGLPSPPGTGLGRVAVAAIAVGALLLLAALLGAPLGKMWIGPAATFVLLAGGGGLLFWVRYRNTTPGIKHDNLFFNSATRRGAVGWGLGILLTGFYVLLYWFPGYIEGGVRLVDPVSRALSGQPANQWFLYGFLYTLAVLVFGVRMLMKYRHNRYQQVRTFSVMFFQLGLAFLLPHILRSLNEPEFYFSYFWPLKYDYLFPGSLRGLVESPGRLGVFMVAWGAIMTFVATPVLTYFFGKRWYCSFVCGCGGLAETLGDPFRHLSDKSLRAWKIERRMIHTVLVLIVVTTALLWINETRGGTALGTAAYGFKKWYGFFFGVVFAGVVSSQASIVRTPVPVVPTPFWMMKPTLP